MWWGILLWGAGLLVGAGEVWARSTFTARFETGVIAGPDIPQTEVLYLHYFPGDGEAILRAEITCEDTALVVRGLRSVRGQVRSAGPVAGVDYTQHPLGRESIDTLYVELVGRKGLADTRWQGRIFSSLDGGTAPAHAAAFGLAIRPPLQLEVQASPQRIFPGEQLELTLAIANLDPRGWSVEGVEWEWPEGLKVLGGGSVQGRAQPLQAGGQDTLRWQVQVAPQVQGVLVLRGRARSTLLAGSPLPEVAFQVEAVPQARIRVEGDFMEAGKASRLICEWLNPGPAALEIAEVQVEIPGVFAEIVVEGPSVALVEEEHGFRVRLESVGVLAPGQKVELGIQAKPLRPGPFPWRSSFRPVNRKEFVPLDSQGMMVKVVRPLEEAGPHPGEEGVYPTDLNLVSMALGEALERELSDFPLGPGAQIYLEPYEKSNHNWLVDDILAGALMRRGYRIVLRKPSPNSSEAGVLHYRLVEAMVVYTPLQKRWNPFTSGRKRQARGDLFLSLGVQNRVKWVQRVRAERMDQVPVGSMDWLGGSEVVRRTVVEPEHLLLERTLSAGIIGGLVYLFFLQ